MQKNMIELAKMYVKKSTITKLIYCTLSILKHQIG